MRNRFWAFGLLVCAACAQTPPGLDVPCKLELADEPEANALDSMAVAIRAVDRAVSISGKPDRDGNLVLKNVPEGRYSLDLAFAGRILTFASESHDLNPLDFDLKSAAAGPLHIVVSLKTADLSLEVNGLPDPVPFGAYNAILSAADPYLTRPQANYTYAVSAPQVTAGSLIPGKYLLFVVEARFTTDLARAAVREALLDKATPVEVLPNGDTQVVAAPIDAAAVQQAIDEVHAGQQAR